MDGSGWVWNFMTQTQPDPLSKKYFNPTHQALKNKPTRRVELDRIGFGRLVDWLHAPTGMILT